MKIDLSKTFVGGIYPNRKEVSLSTELGTDRLGLLIKKIKKCFLPLRWTDDFLIRQGKSILCSLLPSYCY